MAPRSLSAARNGYASDKASGSGTFADLPLYESMGRYSKNKSKATSAQLTARCRADNCFVNAENPRPATTARNIRLNNSARIGQRTTENHSKIRPGNGIHFANGTGVFS